MVCKLIEITSNVTLLKLIELTIGPIVLGDHCFTEDLKTEDNKNQKTPCQNDRVCDRVKNDFVCDCGSDYFGKTCNRIDYCNKTDSIVSININCILI